jgi:hypothetical protein
MELKNFFALFNNQGISNTLFKIIMIVLAIFYFLYAMVVVNQVKIMKKTLQDKHNPLISFITSLQVTVSLILLILAIFLI